MSELDIPKSDILQGLYFVQNVGYIFEELNRLVDGHIQDIADALALEAHLERFAIVTLAVTLLTGNIHVGQEIHFNRLETVALTRLTAPTLYVKGEATRLVGAHLCLGEFHEQGADVGEYARVGGRI